MYTRPRSESEMEISSKTLSVSLGILFLAAVAGANTTPPATCTPHPAILSKGVPTRVTCPPFTVPGGTLTLVTLSFAADYQFGGATGTNVVQVTFAPAGPAEVTWSPASVKLVTSGSRSSGPAPTGTMNALSGISAEAFASPFDVNVTSEVTGGTVASSSGAASVVYTYTPPPPITLSCPAPNGTVWTLYRSALVAAGGVPPYKFSIASGRLPPGASLYATGDLTGTPTTAGTFNFTAQVVDSTGTAEGTTTTDCAITNAVAVMHYTWRREQPASPPCPNLATNVSHHSTYTVYPASGVTVVSIAGPYTRIVTVNPSPAVVIRDQQDYQSPPGQIPYYIALTDSTVRLADTYWVKDNALFYVTPEHELGQLPLNNLDRTLSVRLNCEKNLRFFLPAELP